MELVTISTESQMKEHNYILTQVFTIGQNIDESCVMDKTGDLTFYILYVDGKAVGTLRSNQKENGLKIERVAVLEEYRGNGYGSIMLNKLVEMLKSTRKEGEQIYSYIQAQTQSYYERNGFLVDVEHPMIIQNLKHYKAVLKE